LALILLNILKKLSLNRFRQPEFKELDLVDVTDFLSEIDLSSIEVIKSAPVWMSRAERLLLFSLIFSLRPRSYLEIGTFKGGSALIVSSAMDASKNSGRMVCIDPEPQIDPADWVKIQHRTSMVKGFSPDILPKAVEFIGNQVDFALIDGDHRSASVLRDGEALLPFASQGAFLLFHDCFHPEVRRGIQSLIRENPNNVSDCGILTREYTKDLQGKSSDRWGGMRLIRING
jgi:predicted O-methyltransferase YrrM